jgi:predicted flap endonuclease-1-like 5' DNA nuclease
MFERWGFLLGEIWGLLAIAGLLGLFVGWLIWGRRKVEVAVAAAAPVDTGEAMRLRADLAACTERGRAQADRIAALEAEARGARAAADAARAETARLEADRSATVAPPVEAVMAPVMVPVASPDPAVAAKPAGLAAARGGKADDLKLIKGVGPKLEALCHRLGFYHFDQIAGWTPAEIAWVDDNLEGFKGRVTRDEWVAQARDLAAGLPPRAGGEN